MKDKKKIAIWGPPSSGKSTLAKQLSDDLQIDNVIHTDDYLTWNSNDKWQYISKAQFHLIVDPLLKQDSWIAEGNLGEYISREDILNQADEIIILNPGYLKLFYRIIARGLTRNTSLKLGTHTKENATLNDQFRFRDVIYDMFDSMKIVVRFKKSYIHYLMSLAQNANAKHKLVIKD